MQTVTTLSELRRARAVMTGSVALVPTRGGLHPGKLSLVERARAECDHVGVSLFAGQSSEAHDLDRDLRLLEPLGVDLVWAPSLEAAYPPGSQTWVTVEQVSAPLEGKHRPGHFREVATWVSKLLNVFAPSRAYFGQIHSQQVAIARRMVLDLGFPVELVVCPTIREADGLALSNRNASLGPQERAAASVLYRALATAREAYAAGERDGDALRAILSSSLAAEPLAREEYVSAAEPESLDELEHVEQGALLSIAARIGKTRLIDCAVLT
jgi:pantoate--beta-alanine ligase